MPCVFQPSVVTLNPQPRMVSASLRRCSGDISVSGRRSFPQLSPIIRIAAFTGIGFVSINSKLKLMSPYFC